MGSTPLKAGAGKIALLPQRARRALRSGGPLKSRLRCAARHLNRPLKYTPDIKRPCPHPPCAECAAGSNICGMGKRDIPTRAERIARLDDRIARLKELLSEITDETLTNRKRAEDELKKRELLRKQLLMEI